MIEGKDIKYRCFRCGIEMCGDNKIVLFLLDANSYCFSCAQIKYEEDKKWNQVMKIIQGKKTGKDDMENM